MMIVMLMKEDVGAAANQQQKLLISANLLHLREQINVVPRHGGSRVGKAKNKNRHRHRLAGAMLLDSYYFVDNATYTAKNIRR
jgi:hypothetical protein